MTGRAALRAATSRQAMATAPAERNRRRPSPRRDGRPLRGLASCRRGAPCRTAALERTSLTDPFTKSEMMIVAAARALEGQGVCFVGVGLPNIAVNLAQRTVAPELEMVYEAGVFGARPSRLPLSIGDPTIVTGSTAVVEHARAVRLLPAGRADRRRASWARPRSTGSATSTRRSSGRTTRPRRACPGRGGACEIAINAREVFVIMRQSRRSFVETIDFRTSPGNLGGAEQAERIRREGGWLGRGPTVVVTDLGIYHFDEAGEMRLDSLHEGAIGRGRARDHRLGDQRRAGPRRPRHRRPPRSCGWSARSSIPRASTRSSALGLVRPSRTPPGTPGRPRRRWR